jgi:hypothetical protein
MSETGDASLRRLVDLKNPNGAQSLDCRWQIATAIASGTATRSFFGHVIDGNVKLAVRYLCHGKSNAEFRSELVDLRRAWELRFASDLLTRTVLEARLVARQRIAETATATSATAMPRAWPPPWMPASVAARKKRRTRLARFAAFGNRHVSV